MKVKPDAVKADEMFSFCISLTASFFEISFAVRFIMKYVICCFQVVLQDLKNYDVFGLDQKSQHKYDIRLRSFS
jgi:hypothetical protein